MADININILAVIVVVILNTILGMLWFGPLFGKAWMSAVGLKESDVKNANMVKAMALGTTGGVLMTVVLAYIIDLAQATSVTTGAVTGAIVWAGYLLPMSLGAVAWELKPIRLLYTTAPFWLISSVMSGIILAVWA